MNLEFNKNEFVLGGKYKILDLSNNKELDVQIIELNDVELIYKILNSNVELNSKFIYRELDEINIIDIIDIDIANKLNNQEVFSIKTNEIKGIISRKEIEEFSKDNFLKLDLNDNTVLISITDPKSKTLEETILNKFKDSLSIQFYDIDIEEEYKSSPDWKFVPINNEEAKIILDFILKHKNDNFLIHCEKGQARSAAVGLVIECILKFNGNKDFIKERNSDILNHHRYEPNMIVFNRIMNLYNRLEL